MGHVKCPHRASSGTVHHRTQNIKFLILDVLHFFFGFFIRISVLQPKFGVEHPTLALRANVLQEHRT